DLPAFDHVVDLGESPLESDLLGLPLQDDLGKNVDWSRQRCDVDDGLIPGDDFRSLEAAYAFEARPRRQSHSVRQTLNGRAPVPLQGGQDGDIDTIERGRTSRSH